MQIEQSPRREPAGSPGRPRSAETGVRVSSAGAAGAPIGGETLVRPIAEVLKRQRDVVTWSQALAAGVNKDTISRRIRPNGPWQRILPGVYLTVSGTPTLDQRDIAAVLYAGAGSALTGKAALRWHGLRAGSGQTIDVLVAAPKQRQSAGFVSIHPTMRPPPQVCCRGPVSYVLPARAVADAAVWLPSRDDVRALVAGAVQRRLCTVQQLAVELRDGPVRGSALLRAVIAEVADGIRSSRECHPPAGWDRGLAMT
jgi:hypothetical protein